MLLFAEGTSRAEAERFVQGEWLVGNGHGARGAVGAAKLAQLPEEIRDTLRYPVLFRTCP